MQLDELNKGESALILNIDAPQQLKVRLNSFGITKGATVTLHEMTLSKNTIEISIKKTKVALRISEAKHIEVTAC